MLEATGTVLTNKYSEGYPGRRHYEGQQLVNPIETLVVERAKASFGVEHANVQPYSGSPAHLAVYAAFIEPGDTLLTLDLSSGGRLTHGSPASVTGRWFRPVHYNVDRQTGRIDLDQVRDVALAEKPRMIVCGGTAIPRTIDFAAFAQIAHEADATLVADKPADPSGIRLGTPALTTRGLTESHMNRVAAWIDEAVDAAVRKDEASLDRIAGEVREFLGDFPVPGYRVQT